MSDFFYLLQPRMVAQSLPCLSKRWHCEGYRPVHLQNIPPVWGSVWYVLMMRFRLGILVGISQVIHVLTASIRWHVIVFVPLSILIFLDSCCLSLLIQITQEDASLMWTAAQEDTSPSFLTLTCGDLYGAWPALAGLSWAGIRTGAGAWPVWALAPWPLASRTWDPCCRDQACFQSLEGQCRQVNWTYGWCPLRHWACFLGLHKHLDSYQGIHTHSFGIIGLHLLQALLILRGKAHVPHKIAILRMVSS